MNIKAIILDVDGVIVGEKIGYNSPYPHPDVIQRLKAIRASGVTISLCTAKPYRSIERIVTEAGLANLHITDGGSVLVDPSNLKDARSHIINKPDAFNAIQAFTSKDIYTEFYTVDNYYVQKNMQQELTETHSHILQFDPIFVDSLAEESTKHDIVKIMPIARNKTDKADLVKIFESAKLPLILSWGVHPIALPHQFGIVTANDVSKEQAATDIAIEYSVDKSEILGIGDSTSDWQFIKNCGFRGVMDNATDELKQLVSSSDKAHYYIGGHVDNNGVLDIFDTFQL